MRAKDSVTPAAREAASPPSAGLDGLLLAFLGVVGFSGTAPATRLVVGAWGPLAALLGRSLVAGVAAILLLWARHERPPRAHLPALAVVSAGIVVGFPLLSALAARTIPAAHLAVIVGALPIATAVVARLRGGERAPRSFWLGGLAGLGAIVAFALVRGGGGVGAGHLLAVAAVGASAVGYAEGARLSRALGGWRVVCWALALAAPPLAVVAVAVAWRAPGGAAVSARPLLAVLYLGGISMFLAFFAWYEGLARAGIARASPLQLAQLPLSLLWSAWLLGERIGLPEGLAAAALVGSILFSLRARPTRPVAPFPHTRRGRS